MQSQRHLVRMPSNRRVPEARSRHCVTALDGAGTPISARYQESGGVREGDWSGWRAHLFFAADRLVIRQPDMEERRNLKGARILP